MIPRGILPRMCLTLTVIVIVVTWAANLSRAQVKSDVFGSLHDINGAGCKSCHASHNGSVAIPPGADQSTGQILLWARVLSNVTFGTYQSPSMNQLAVEAGGLPLTRSEPRAYTLLCMSCHDGVTTATVSLASSAQVGNPANSDGLRNDHPVNVQWTHQTVVGGQPSCFNCHVIHGGRPLTQGLLPFYNRSIQCSSCHDPHSRANEKFLRVTNTTSAICRHCHG